jgi:CRISPR/Cas system endoribonuclease Cas6 (RAMP superfamily)
MPVAGVTGSWRLAGDLRALWPFLYLGQWLHVGKKTTFGLGHYQLIAHGGDES